MRRWVFCVLLLTAAAARPQSTPKQQFEDLAHRAEAALDKRPEEAAGLYRQALALRPAWGEGWMYLGAALYQLNRFAEATDALRKGLELAPGIGTGWALLGMSESQLEDQDQALADIRKGESLGLGANLPFEVAVRVRAVEMLVKSSSFDEGFSQLQPLAKHPEHFATVELRQLR